MLAAAGRFVADQALEALLDDAEVGLDVCNRDEPKDKRPILTDSQKVAAAWASFMAIRRTLRGLLGKKDTHAED